MSERKMQKLVHALSAPMSFIVFSVTNGMVLIIKKTWIGCTID